MLSSKQLSTSGDGKSIFMKQPRTFLLFIEAILQLSPIVNGEFIILVAIVTKYCVR